MNLGRQIHTLLKRQSSVYINRLGTFKRVHTPATFDAKRHVFLPPITFIEFDSLSSEGYDFVTYIQQANQLERTEAEALVEEAVSSILDKINQLGQVNLDNLGQLIGYGNSYVFKPLDLSGFNYSPVEDNFPVEDIVKKEEAKVEEKEQVVVVPEPVDFAATASTAEPEQISPEVPEPEVPEPKVPESEVTETVEEVVQPVEVPQKEEEPVAETYVEPVFPAERKSTGAYVYAILAVIAVVLLGGLYYYSTYMKESPVIAQEEQTVVLLDTVATDSLLAEVPVDSSMVATDSTIVTPEPKENQVEKEVPPPANHRYTIVIGTHRTLAQAYEEAEAFNKDGHKSVRVITPNLAKNLKRVVWDTYASKEERDSALRYVKKHIKTDAWPDVIR